MQDPLFNLYLYSLIIGIAYFLAYQIFIPAIGFESDVVDTETDGFDGVLEDDMDFDADNFEGIAFEDDIELDVTSFDDLDLAGEENIDISDLNGFHLGGEEVVVSNIESSENEAGEINSDWEYKINFFSPKTWVAMLTSFGCAGLVSVVLEISRGFSLSIAIIIGILTGVLLFSFRSYLQAHSVVRDSPLKVIGKEGVVILTIPPKRSGLVKLKFITEEHVLRAICPHSKREIKKGEQVKVVKYYKRKHLLIVKKI